MLLEKKQRENSENYREPDFHPRYRQTLPAGLGVKQVTFKIKFFTHSYFLV